MSDDLVRRLSDLAEVLTPWGQQIALDARNRIEELEAKLDLSEGALDVASRSWGECQRMLEQTEAKLSKSEALLAKAVEALGEIAKPKVGPDLYWSDDEVARWRAGWYRKYGDIARTTLAELKGEKDD